MPPYWMSFLANAHKGKIDVNVSLPFSACISRARSSAHLFCILQQILFSSSFAPEAMCFWHARLLKINFG
jgi:hypothetical protein